MSYKCFIEIECNKFELPVKKDTVGPSVIDVRELYKKTGHFTSGPTVPFLTGSSNFLPSISIKHLSDIKISYQFLIFLSIFEKNSSNRFKNSFKPKELAISYIAGPYSDPVNIILKG